MDASKLQLLQTLSNTIKNAQDEVVELQTRCDELQAVK
jgi:hypothetical protein